MTKDTTHTGNPAKTSEVSGSPALSLDWERFGSYLDASDLTDAQKREFLETLWSLVVSFVDLGLGLHPLQLIMDNSCEQNGDLAGLIAAETPSVVSSSQKSNPEFNAAAERDERPARESATR